MTFFDVSYCQPKGTVTSFAKKGDGVIIRNGYLHKTDTMLRSHMDEAVSQMSNKAIGSYTYIMADNLSEAVIEAEETVQRLSPYYQNITAPVYLDMENKKYCYRYRRGENTSILLTELEKLFAAGYDVGIYTNQSFSINFIDMERILKKWGNKVSIWLADYRGSRHYIPSYFKVDMWQYGTTKIKNVEIDTNICYIDFYHRSRNF